MRLPGSASALHTLFCISYIIQCSTLPPARAALPPCSYQKLNGAWVDDDGDADAKFNQKCGHGVRQGKPSSAQEARSRVVQTPTKRHSTGSSQQADDSDDVTDEWFYRWEQLAPLLEDFLQERSAGGDIAVLDVGCGTSSLLPDMMNNGMLSGAFVGIDYSPAVAQHLNVCVMIALWAYKKMGLMVTQTGTFSLTHERTQAKHGIVFPSPQPARPASSAFVTCSPKKKRRRRQARSSSPCAEIKKEEVEEETAKWALSRAGARAGFAWRLASQVCCAGTDLMLVHVFCRTGLSDHGRARYVLSQRVFRYGC